jgi:hypothetical protein
MLRTCRRKYSAYSANPCAEAHTFPREAVHVENSDAIEIVQAFIGNAEKILSQLFRVVTLSIRRMAYCRVRGKVRRSI